MSSPRPFRRQVLINTGSTVLANGWAMIITVASLPFLLSGMGAAAFGLWVLVQTFSAFNGWVSLADLGVGTAVTRAAAERSAVGNTLGARHVISAGLLTFVGLGAATASVLALLGPLTLPVLLNAPSSLRSDLRLAIVIFAVQLLIDLITAGCEACLEGLQRVDRSRGVDAFRRTTVAAATVAAAQLDGDLATVATASAGAAVLSAIVAVVALGRTLDGRLPRPTWREARELLRYGRTVSVLRSVGVLQRTMDRFVVGAILGPTAVAPLEVATQLMNGAEATLSATTYAVVPSAARLGARGDLKTLRELLLRGTKYALLATTAVALVVGVLAEPIVRVWIGPNQHQAAGLAVVALMAVLAQAPAQVGTTLLLGLGQAGRIIRPAVVAVAINLGLSIALVHAVGAVGAFQATLIAATFLVVLLLRSVLSTADVPLRTFLQQALLPIVPPTVAAVLVGGIVLVLGWSDVITVAVGAVGMLLAFGLAAAAISVRREEFAELRTLIASHSE